MGGVKRYEVYQDMFESGFHIDEASNGEWIKHDDHAQMIYEFRTRAENAERERDEEREKVAALVWWARSDHIGFDYYVVKHRCNSRFTMGYRNNPMMTQEFENYEDAILAAYRHRIEAGN